MAQLKLGADLVLVQMERLKGLGSNNWHTQSLCVTVYKDKNTICKLVLKNSIIILDPSLNGSFHYNFSSKLSALQEL